MRREKILTVMINVIMILNIIKAYDSKVSVKKTHICAKLGLKESKAAASTLDAILDAPKAKS